MTRHVALARRFQECFKQIVSGWTATRKPVVAGPHDLPANR